MGSYPKLQIGRSYRLKKAYCANPFLCQNLPVDCSNTAKKPLFTTGIWPLCLRQHSLHGYHHGDVNGKQKFKVNHTASNNAIGYFHGRAGLPVSKPRHLCVEWMAAIHFYGKTLKWCVSSYKYISVSVVVWEHVWQQDICGNHYHQYWLHAI